MNNRDMELKSLLDTMKSSLKFLNFLDRPDDKSIDFDEKDCNLLLLIFISLYFTMRVDDFLKITNVDDLKNVDIDLDKDFIEDLANTITTKNEDDGRYYFEGGLSFKRPEAVIDKVRNKLAHGDAFVEEDNIVFIENGCIAKIKISSLYDFIYKFNEKFKYNKLEGQYDRVIINDYHSDLSFIEKDMDKYRRELSKFMVLHIIDEPVTKRDSNYYKLYVEVIDYIKYYMASYPDFNIFGLIAVVKDKFPNLEEKGMILHFNYNSLDKEDYYESIIGTIYRDNLNFNGDNKYLKNELVSALAFKKQEGRFNKSNLIDGILFDLDYINNAKRIKEIYKSDKVILDYNTIGKCYNDYDKLVGNGILDSVSVKFYLNMIVNLDDGFISMYLAIFYALYQYGLEDIYMKCNKFSIYNLASGKYLDFSKLDLSELDDPNMTKEFKFNKFIDDYNIYYKDNNYRNSIVNKVMEFKDKLDNLINLKKIHPDIKDSSIDKKRDLYNDTVNLLNEYDKEKIEVDKFLETFDQDKYQKNIDILKHIRNAIAHGNIKSDTYYDGNILKKKITITDYDSNGNIVYNKTLKLKDFIKIFSKDNYNIITSYLINNISDKTLVNHKYKKELKRLHKKY